MKGQFSLEQLVAMTLFVAFVSYVLFTVLNLVPTYNSQVKAERLKSEAYQMSELLINNPGNPANWNLANQPISFGLSNQTANLTNYVSTTKMGYLSSFCFAPNYAGYSQVSQWLGTDRQFSILLLSRNCAIPPVDCRPNSSVFRGSSVNVSIKRYVAFNQNCFGELDLQVW